MRYMERRMTTASSFRRELRLRVEVAKVALRINPVRSLMHDFRRRPKDLKVENTRRSTLCSRRCPCWERFTIYAGKQRRYSISPRTERKPPSDSRNGSRKHTSGLDWEPFIPMLENHWDGILAYFDDKPSSGAVEGINTKLRVITRRSYGIQRFRHCGHGVAGRELGRQKGRPDDPQHPRPGRTHSGLFRRCYT